MYNQGVSHVGLLVDIGAENDIIEKSGAWYSYGDLRLGQGKENAKVFLAENPDVADEIEVRVRVALDLPSAGNGAADPSAEDDSGE